MKHTFKFDFEFENDEGVATDRTTVEYAEEEPHLSDVISKMSAFISAAYGYPVELSYKTQYSE